MSGKDVQMTPLYLTVSGYGFSRSLGVSVPIAAADWLQASGNATIELLSSTEGSTEKSIFRLYVLAATGSKPKRTSKKKPVSSKSRKTTGA